MVPSASLNPQSSPKWQVSHPLSRDGDRSWKKLPWGAWLWVVRSGFKFRFAQNPGASGQYWHIILEQRFSPVWGKSDLLFSHTLYFNILGNTKSKNWCFWTVVLEKTLESPLDCKEIQPVHPKGDQPWVFFGRTDAEAETPVLWPPHAKSWLIEKDSDAGRDWGQEEKGMTEGEMAGWHHRLDGREFEWTPGAGDGQRGLACCSTWGHKESDTTEWLNWTELKLNYVKTKISLWRVTRQRDMEIQT